MKLALILKNLLLGLGIHGVRHRLSKHYVNLHNWIEKQNKRHNTMIRNLDHVLGDF